MKTTRKLSLKNRIFGKEDIKRLAEVIEHQSKLATKSEHHSDTEYTFYFSDNTTYESDNVAIIDQAPLDSKRSERCNFRFHNYSLERYINVDLAHGDHSSGWSNCITVSGPEITWVNDNFVQLSEIINSLKQQCRWFHKFKFILVSLLAIGIGSLVLSIITIIVDIILDKPTIVFDTPTWLISIKTGNPWVLYLLLWFFRWMIGIGWGAFPIYYWIVEAWPSIELDLGPDHFKKEKMRRNRLITLITLIVIPTSLSIVLDWLA